MDILNAAIAVHVAEEGLLAIGRPDMLLVNNEGVERVGDGVFVRTGEIVNDVEQRLSGALSGPGVVVGVTISVRNEIAQDGGDRREGNALLARMEVAPPVRFAGAHGDEAALEAPCRRSSRDR